MIRGSRSKVRGSKFEIRADASWKERGADWRNGMQPSASSVSASLVGVALQGTNCKPNDGRKVRNPGEMTALRAMTETD